MSDSSTAAALREISRLVVQLSAQLRYDLASPNLAPSGAQKVLLLLNQQALPVPRIADICSTSRQNIQILVNGLFAAGHAQTRPNPRHKRSPLIELTPAGQAVAESLAEEESGWMERMSRNFSARELATALEVLQKLRGAVEPSPRSAQTKPDPSPDVVATDYELPVSLL